MSLQKKIRNTKEDISQKKNEKIQDLYKDLSNLKLDEKENVFMKKM